MLFVLINERWHLKKPTHPHKTNWALIPCDNLMIKFSTGYYKMREHKKTKQSVV